MPVVGKAGHAQGEARCGGSRVAHGGPGEDSRYGVLLPPSPGCGGEDMGDEAKDGAGAGSGWGYVPYQVQPRRLGGPGVLGPVLAAPLGQGVSPGEEVLHPGGCGQDGPVGPYR